MTRGRRSRNSKQEVLLAGGDLVRLSEIAQLLRGSVVVTLLEEANPVESLLLREASPEAAVVWLNADENVWEIGTLLQTHATTRFVFLARELPLRAAIARVIYRAGGVVLRAADNSLIIVATLTALLAHSADARA